MSTCLTVRAHRRTSLSELAQVWLPPLRSDPLVRRTQVRFMGLSMPPAQGDTNSHYGPCIGKSTDAHCVSLPEQRTPYVPTTRQCGQCREPQRVRHACVPGSSISREETRISSLSAVRAKSKTYGTTQGEPAHTNLLTRTPHPAKRTPRDHTTNSRTQLQPTNPGLARNQGLALSRTTSLNRSHLTLTVAGRHPDPTATCK